MGPLPVPAEDDAPLALATGGLPFAGPASGPELRYEARVKTDDDYKGKLTDEQFRVTRQKGTERAFTGEYHDKKDPGVYKCICCGEVLFTSDTKYDSGSGWPSFYQPASEGVIAEDADTSYGMRRVEVMCKACDAHLGHVFEDGPQPTGLRYCINSASLDFEEKK